MRVFIILWLLSVSVYANDSFNWQNQALEIDDIELSISQVVPTGEVAKKILWVPSEYGVLPQEKRIAEQLAQQGVATTFFDPFEALFLAPTSSALQKIPAGWISKILEQKPFDYVVAGNKAGVLALAALRDFYQTAKPPVGVILLNPDLLTQTPAPGEKGIYWPHVSQTNLPVFILQGELSPWRWQLASVQSELGKGGAEVFLKMLPKVRDRFYFRPDANAFEQQFSQQLSKDIQLAMQALTPYLTENRQVLKSAELDRPVKMSSQQEKSNQSLELQVYRGAQNLQLSLQDMQSKTFDLSSYRGKVVLVNFWASWCPPCVHEMPSMAGLKSQLGSKNFEILAVNLGEAKADIEKFMQAHPLNFPVLLDETGQTAQSWKVMAYPSSFIVDKTGQIRYALFGATDWQSDTHVNKLKSLIHQNQ
ncbi:TlpA disulfide reductase family protein [Thiomicrorhabdus indica]|uniref:TlpA disulfide reductase family protein n=1 Tax=Thiomicrorhabdus indica TaxID=2267253 RepID=UPI002AA83C7C|nr:TlpA disulfide reductase family protein [Thiomicrorhabdus indica]